MSTSTYPTFSGKVVHGFKIGKSLGFPTANIDAEEKDIPSEGVYIVQILFNFSTHYGIMSIGNRPTFEGDAKTVEVHLLDFSNDLYLKTLTIQPLLLMRENKKFDSPDLLIQQLEQDKNFALQYLNNLK